MNSPAVGEIGLESPKQASGSEEQKTDSLTEVALLQVRHFYQVFFQSGEGAQPTPRERAQAAEHIARLGAERARFLVLFAYQQAKSTRFPIQTYGGIIQYEGRAIAEFDAASQKRAQVATQRARDVHQKRFQGAYEQYLHDTLGTLSTRPDGPLASFLEEERRLRQGLASPAGPVPGDSAIGRRLLENFDTPEARLRRFRDFLSERFNAGRRVDEVLSFWEWDRAQNPERLA